ncbi:MAG: ATP-binding cassette domain-containing protein [Candidatus Latescibacterota bacterium]
MALVEMEKVSKVYHVGKVDIWALSDIDLQIEEGSFVAVVGPSGSGKTTLLNLIGCLDKPTAGRVRVGEFDVSTSDCTQAARVSKRTTASDSVSTKYESALEHFHSWCRANPSRDSNGATTLLLTVSAAQGFALCYAVILKML